MNLRSTIRMACGYRLDLLVNDEVVVEIKSIERLLPVHTAQMVTYLRLSGYVVGLLMNFNTPVLKDGIRRVLKDRPHSTVTSDLKIETR